EYRPAVDHSLVATRCLSAAHCAGVNATPGQSLLAAPDWVWTLRTRPGDESSRPGHRPRLAPPSAREGHRGKTGLKPVAATPRPVHSGLSHAAADGAAVVLATVAGRSAPVAAPAASYSGAVDAAVAPAHRAGCADPR